MSYRNVFLKQSSNIASVLWQFIQLPMGQIAYLTIAFIQIQPLGQFIGDLDNKGNSQPNLGKAGENFNFLFWKSIQSCSALSLNCNKAELQFMTN